MCTIKNSYMIKHQQPPGGGGGPACNIEHTHTPSETKQLEWFEFDKNTNITFRVVGAGVCWSHSKKIPEEASGAAAAPAYPPTVHSWKPAGCWRQRAQQLLSGLSVTEKSAAPPGEGSVGPSTPPPSYLLPVQVSQLTLAKWCQTEQLKDCENKGHY